jgi:hypothetical protein
MKLTNLIDNVNKQTLSITSSVWNWLNGLVIGSLAVTAAMLVCYALNLDDEGLNVKYEIKKKK